MKILNLKTNSAFLFLIFCSGCAGGKVKDSDPSSGKDTGLKAVAETTKELRASSPIDPKNLPKVEIKGVRDDEFVIGGALKFQISVSNYPMAKDWQFAQVFLNRRPLAPMTLESQNFEVIEGLNAGLNQITVYLARSSGLPVKSPLAVASVHFFYSKKVDTGDEKTEAGIFIISPNKSSRILAQGITPFDFVISKAMGRKLKVYYTLDGTTREVAPEAAPFEFVNLAKGPHLLKVELLDSKGKKLKGAFVKDEVQFLVE